MFSFLFLATLVFSPLGISLFKVNYFLLNSPFHICCFLLHLVVRGKSFLIETETEEYEANVSGYDGEGINEALRALKSRTQNKSLGELREVWIGTFSKPSKKYE